ncbi:MAG: pesticin C-terminus-like muramidase, partial [Ferruginibacter sp.]
MPVTNLSPRIKAIQKIISVPASGQYDLQTIKRLIEIMGISAGATMQLRKEAIQSRLGFTGKAVDGIFGVNTTTRLEIFVSNLLPVIPASASMIISKKGLDLIVESEISSEKIYNAKYKKPIWPESASGITIGIGFDLGYYTEAKIESTWGPYLTKGAVNKLKKVAGLKGTDAKNALRNNTGNIKSVEVDYRSALEVFYTDSVPAYAKSTKGIYPDINKLPPDAQAALLSIVYNRGSSLTGDRRREMKNIVALVTAVDLPGIAKEIRSMKRLWTTAATKGLVIRREKEAVLVE